MAAQVCARRLALAFNGQQGYQLAVADPPDLIQLDVRTPSAFRQALQRQTG
jgi:hypothetical protein